MYPITYTTRADQVHAAERLGVDLAIVQAVTKVEARGSGFLQGTDLPVILFEGHQFHRFTSGRFDAQRPDLSHPKWTRAHYRGGRAEYERLTAALALVPDDPEPALKSASWGMFQIMGFNHEAAGYGDARSMVNDFSMSEGAQLNGFVSFVIAHPVMAGALRARDWAGFARRYNGPGYAKNDYDTKLVSAFSAAKRALEEEDADGAMPLERGDVVRLQSALNLATGAGLAVDGWQGPKTRSALTAFQAREGLPTTGKLDGDTAARLGLTTNATGDE